MHIQEQLRLLREGVITEDSSTFDTELVESWFIENDGLTESVSLSELITEGIILIESNTATPDESLAFMAKFKLKLKNLKDKFDIYEGIKDLQMIRARLEAREIDKSRGFLNYMPFIGPAIEIMDATKYFKGKDPSVFKKYLQEAEKFKAIIAKEIREAEKNSDLKSVSKLTRISKKLDFQIGAFKRDIKGFTGHEL